MEHLVNEIEKKLSYRFKWFGGMIVFTTAMNTFFVVFHHFDVDGSEKTLRYKLGSIFYMINFFIQTLLLLATFVYAFVLYIKLALFLKPKARQYDANGNAVESGDDDDTYVDQNRDPFEVKRDTFRKGFEPKYLKFNLNFIILLVIFTVRVGTYVGLRLVTKERIFEWITIKPGVIYLSFVTDIAFLVWVLCFIVASAPLNE